MTVQELHIDFDQKLDKVHSGLFESFTVEEKDWWLNEAQMRFLKQRTSPKINTKREGHQYTQKRYDDLEELIRSVSTSATVISNNKVCITLPDNYYMLINDRSLVEWNCNAISKETELKFDYTVIIPFITDTRSDRINDYFDGLNIDITINGITTTIFDLSVIEGYENGVNSNEEFFSILPHILDAFRESNIFQGVYINEYQSLYANNSLILSLNPDEVLSLPINIQYSWRNGQIINSYQVVQSTYNTFINQDSAKQFECENRIVKTEDLYQILKHDFAKTKYESPVSNLSNGKLFVHCNKTFNVIAVNIDYYKIPNKIDFKASITSDINDMRHSEIVDIAVQLVSAHIIASNYQTIVSENSFNE